MSESHLIWYTGNKSGPERTQTSQYHRKVFQEEILCTKYWLGNTYLVPCRAGKWPSSASDLQWLEKILRNIFHSDATDGAAPIVRVHIVAFCMMSLSGSMFRVTGPLWGESTGNRWIPLTNASDAELWCFPWSEPGQNGSANNRDAGDLRRHRAHYDVPVMATFVFHCGNWSIIDDHEEIQGFT